MKLVLIGPMKLSIPCEKGAVEEIIWQIAKRLNKRYSVEIFNPIIHKFARLQAFFKASKFYTNFRDNVTVIHSHNLYASLMLIAQEKFSHVLTLHYPPWITKISSLKHVMLTALKILNTRGVVITVPSIYIKQKLKELHINSIYIPNGVDIEIFNPKKKDQSIRERLLDGYEFLLLNVARIHPDKNQLMLLKALRHVVKEYRYIRMVFVGPVSGYFHKQGTNRYFIQLQNYTRKYGLENNVIFLGEVSRDSKVRLMASSDIFLHPSLREAAPLTVLEAMASGLPVIAFNLPYYHGYLIHKVNALIVSLGDIQLANGIIQLLSDDSLRRHLSNKARTIVERIYSWNSIVKQYDQLYERIINFS